MDQKRDSLSIDGIGGGKGWELPDDAGVATLSLVEELSLILLLPDDSTTSSDSMLTGSPIVVSFASFESDGLLFFESLPEAFCSSDDEYAPRSLSVGLEFAVSAFKLT